MFLNALSVCNKFFLLHIWIFSPALLNWAEQRRKFFFRNTSSLSSSNWVASVNLPQQITNPLEIWFHKVKQCLLWFSCKILAMLSCSFFYFNCVICFIMSLCFIFNHMSVPKTVLCSINTSANPINFQAFFATQNSSWRKKKSVTAKRNDSIQKVSVFYLFFCFVSLVAIPCLTLSWPHEL